jgi:hypothetical protein
MDYTIITLGQLLSSKDETIKRNAVSILKRIQDVVTCKGCGATINYWPTEYTACWKCKNFYTV